MNLVESDGYKLECSNAYSKINQSNIRMNKLYVCDTLFLREMEGFTNK